MEVIGQLKEEEKKEKIQDLTSKNMNLTTIIMNKNLSTETKNIIENWSKESNVTAITTKPEEVSQLEINDTGTRIVYVGENKDCSKIATNTRGIHLNENEVRTIQECNISVMSNITYCKIPKILKLGINPIKINLQKNV